MTLKMNKNAKTIIPRVLGVIVLVLIVAFFVRVAVFENGYYAEKEGSERAVSASNVENTTGSLVEIAPTEAEISKHTVNVDEPRYLTIEKLNISNARILSVGVDGNNALGTPNNIFDAGWYTGSSKPGQGGTLLMDGHNGGPHVRGIFKELPSLAVGDLIVIERGDGVKFTYSVVDNVEVPLSESDKYMTTAMKTPEAGKESVTLISCTGEWSSTQNTYLARQFVRAVLAK